LVFGGRSIHGTLTGTAIDDEGELKTTVGSIALAAARS
jgi:hypothetical protein